MNAEWMNRVSIFWERIEMLASTVPGRSQNEMPELIGVKGTE
jgi:hypothetical protein